ncbi:hypothetical protein O6P43_026669 [Quillaja saponaria]|uniref:Uncharacterized protein n=1 Tax=Quillaja saponaria TaxID=32244 RepID=A0AAD7L2P0_QUISA|nr:hypothetical protein O6P43_026669 [Quillaja saponaria]
MEGFKEQGQAGLQAMLQELRTDRFQDLDAVRIRVGYTLSGIMFISYIPVSSKSPALTLIHFFITLIMMEVAPTILDINLIKTHPTLLHTTCLIKYHKATDSILTFTILNIEVTSKALLNNRTIHPTQLYKLNSCYSPFRNGCYAGSESTCNYYNFEYNYQTTVGYQSNGYEYQLTLWNNLQLHQYYRGQTELCYAHRKENVVVISIPNLGCPNPTSNSTTQVPSSVGNTEILAVLSSLGVLEVKNNRIITQDFLGGFQCANAKKNKLQNTLTSGVKPTWGIPIEINTRRIS